MSVSEVEGDGPHHASPDGRTVRRIGKKAAGRALDSALHNGFPRWQVPGSLLELNAHAEESGLNPDGQVDRLQQQVEQCPTRYETTMPGVLFQPGTHDLNRRLSSELGHENVPHVAPGYFSISLRLEMRANRSNHISFNFQRVVRSKEQLPYWRFRRAKIFSLYQQGQNLLRRLKPVLFASLNEVKEPRFFAKTSSLLVDACFPDLHVMEDIKEQRSTPDIGRAPAPPRIRGAQDQGNDRGPHCSDCGPSIPIGPACWAKPANIGQALEPLHV
ncbi:hypothetical protein EA655_11030 [Pseudoxanthomonas winnipegensis]|uniref:Uncharacterized protein n=1 Tax=Pseudoxanthomonas winnipegensis TaxID=2480810 RepID=A0A4Q8M5F1_9GAMM|nr:hypothetical protein EA655_11030 [Pseudoxanthomonas winnipegensis]